MRRILVGTYAAKGGAGLVPLTHDPANGRWSAGDAVAPAANASFGLASARFGHRYLVDEEAGTVAAYDRDGRRLAEVPSGAAPCHLALSAGERLLAAANYEGGSVTLFHLDEGGLPIRGETWRHHGHGPHPDRQDAPHAHWVGFRGDDLLCVDLGTDRILSRPAAGPDVPRTVYAAPPGSGPRHLAFHPTLAIAYLVSELASTLTVLRHAGAALEPQAIHSTLPPDAGAGSLGGAIAIDADARLLHVTNRGHDSIATFALDAEGMPRLLGHVPSGGRSPRFLLPMAGHVLVAHEESGGVAAFRRDADGRPAGTPVSIDVPGAAFLMEE